MKMKTRMQRAVPLGLAVTLVLAPAVRVYADDRTQIAAAIGAEESKPAAPAQTPSTTAPAKAPAKSTSPTSAATAPAKTTAADASSDSGFSQAQIWLGVGVAAFLAAVGGGGGGGGSTTSH